MAITATMTASVVVLRVVVRRAHRGTRRRRWRWRWRCRRLHGASSAQHRASRARIRTSPPRIARIVTISVPPAHDRHARATAALAHSVDHARGVALAMAVKEAVGYIARHVRHENRASLARTSTPSTRIARVITDFRPPRARASCGGGGARSSLDRTHVVWRRRWRWR